MTNATRARLGVLKGQTDGSWAQENANFEEICAGEIITAFDEVNIFKDLHRVRTIEHGKSASFPVLGKMAARYHKSGTPILGSNNPQIGKRVIVIDDLLISDVFIDDLEDMKSHFEVRHEYTKQAGHALSNAFDHKIARIGYIAARTAAATPDHFGGGVLTHADAATDPKALQRMLFKAAEILDTKDVPSEDRHIILAPLQYYMLVENKDLLNTDWGGAGSLAKATLPEVAGMVVHKSNHLPNGKKFATKLEGENNDYTGDFTKSVALVMNRQAVGTVKLFDLKVEFAAHDFKVIYQGDLMLAKYAMGHGVLNPSCAVEIAVA